jgi:hypothetical protein
MVCASHFKVEALLVSEWIMLRPERRRIVSLLR